MPTASLTVRVIPRAKKSGVTGTRDGALLVRLTAPPVDNAANEELVGLLAELLTVPKRAVTIASGERGRLKRVTVEGIDTASAMARLVAAHPNG
jgi:uncharacterized protein (TIGR00251 family)